MTHDPHPIPVLPLEPANQPSLARRARFIVAFFLCVLALDRLVGLAFDQVVVRSQFRYSTLYRGDIDADLVIVGNSRGLHSLYAPEMTERLDLPTFNISYNGLGMDAIEVIVRDYLDLAQGDRKPKAILLEISAASLPPGEVYHLFQPYFGRSERLRVAMRQFTPDRYWGCLLFHSFRFNGTTPEKCLLYFRNSDQNWISPADRVIPQALLDRRFVGGEPKILDSQAAAYARIAKHCRSAGVRLIPFIAPYLPGAVSKDSSLADAYAIQLDVAAPAGLELPSILDYSQAVDEERAFSDRVHTNARGAEILLDRMIADGVFRSLKAADSGANAP